MKEMGGSEGGGCVWRMREEGEKGGEGKRKG